MDENEVPVTLRASVRGGMKPGYMCSTAASRQIATPPKPIVRRRPLQNLNAVPILNTRRTTEVIIQSPITPRATPRKKTKIQAESTKKDAATNTEGIYEDIDSVIQLLRELNHDVDKPKCTVCFGNGEKGWRAMIPCGHEFCEDCHVWEKEYRCPICREFIIQPLKVYR